MGEKMNRAISVVSICVLIVVFSSCMGFKAFWDMDADLIEAGYKTADTLVARTNPPLVLDQAIIVASFVSINKLEESSTFGRTISEYIISRLAQQGYKVIEMKFRKSVFIQNKGGEFMLSRELKEISTEHNVQAVIVGTYSLARDVVYISSSVINPSNSTIRATYDFSMPLGGNTMKLLEK